MRKLYAVPFFILLSAFQVQAQTNPECVTSGGVLSIINLGDVEIKTQCCAGLEVEKIGNDEVCFKKDDSPVDTSLQACTNDASCSDGKGCFVQNSDDHFSGPVSSQSEAESQDQAIEAVENKISSVIGEEEDAEPKPNGQSCVYHAECASYNCLSKKQGEKYIKTCEEKRICRLAREDEQAIGSVQCEEELYKDASNTCKNKTDGVYLGLLGDVQIETDPSNECKMNIPDEAKLAGQTAMKALRAMEWLFLKSDGDHEDCLQIMNPVMKEKIAKVLFEKRKVITQQFNETWDLIKKDFLTIKAAQEADAAAMAQVVQLSDPEHGQNLTNELLKSRSSSGFDMLIMMKRRNILFLDYEKKMEQAVTDTFNEVRALENSMANFNGNSYGWNYTTADQQNHSFYRVSCRRSWWDRFRGRKRKKVYKRWARQYTVSATAVANNSLSTNELFVNSLASMNGGNKSAVINELKKSNYYLMDPLIPIPKKYNNYGSGSTGHSRWLNGSGTGSLSSIRSNLPSSYSSYLVGMNPENKLNYIYEPELVQITDGEVTKQEENDCVRTPESLTKPECSNMNKYVQDVSDIALAQFWAFSAKKSKNYSNYFNNVNSWRRRLFNYYSVNYANLRTYYGVLKTYREKQNECINQRLGLVGGLIEGGGYNPGLANNYWDPNQYLQETFNPGPQSTGQVKNNLSVNHSFSGFSGATNQLQNSGALKDNIASSGANIGSGSINSTASANFAANLKKMTDANKKNMSSADFNQKSKDVMDSIKSVAGSAGASSTASLGSGIGNGSSALGGMSGAGAAKLGDDLKGEADKKDGSAKADGIATAETKASGSGPGIAGGFGNGMSGITSGSSSGMASADVSGTGAYQDPTGMSDEEKDRLMANYERTKSQYNPNENDSLFKVVSKAYVRNLEKVLTKKKKTLESTK
ncbi:MAG: hypothetical protein ACOVP4_13170 [Bacteriovoracaceae bacterium]